MIPQSPLLEEGLHDQMKTEDLRRQQLSVLHVRYVLVSDNQ